MEEVVLLYASNRRLEGWVSLDGGGPVELLKWRSASTLEAAPMWVSPTQTSLAVSRRGRASREIYIKVVVRGGGSSISTRVSCETVFFSFGLNRNKPKL
jgi:hypothetical protein